ncbi:rRNA-binding ribosome biosynthesis protein rpf2 [Saguinus oedipus]|uniref:Ribosome production factor 2 homolog n=1 Tax=Saguinus oedipus TaxID=9490 RepID=A0ABQ9VYJ6_SAGOE|nr:rRNA-binding ribosome biosynthesis protein rpf2 [Saguinus oedipus]
MLIKGGNANATVTEVLKDVLMSQVTVSDQKGAKPKASEQDSGPRAILKNITRPFEDQTSLLWDKVGYVWGDVGRKKRGKIVGHFEHTDHVGRMYDYHVLDMIELGIENFVSLKDIKNSKCPEGTKPMLIFAGDDFDVTEDYRRLKSLLIDGRNDHIIRKEKQMTKDVGPAVSNIRLAGLEYVLHFTALNGKIYFRSYNMTSFITKPTLASKNTFQHHGSDVDTLSGVISWNQLLLKKSGCRTPRIELEEMGPSLDLVLRRTHLASDDLYKLSMKMPKALKPKKKKNISHDTFGTTYGRIHMQKQDLSKLQTRKMKGLKKRPAERITEDPEKKTLPCLDTSIRKTYPSTSGKSANQPRDSHTSEGSDRSRVADVGSVKHALPPTWKQGCTGTICGHYIIIDRRRHLQAELEPG